VLAGMLNLGSMSDLSQYDIQEQLSGL